MDEETLLRANEAATEQRTAPLPTDVRERAAAVDAGSDAARSLSPGTCLRNRYLLETAIGRGAMGEVWKAKDLLIEEAHDRNPYVAIKVLLADIERHPQSFATMHREASRTQKLAHPNIVTVFTLDRDDRTGRAFIAMELLDGEPLDKFIRRYRERPMAAKELWPIIKGMAEGLAYAHRRGIVHSDFKPGNVFLTREGVPKILDFGIARAVREEGAAGARDDDDSVVSGYTEAYAAPEVLAGEGPHRADDVFALGLVAYELLTGERALGRCTSSEAQQAGLKLQPIKTIRRSEWRVIEQALAFERRERWPDAGKFLEALQRRVRLQIALAASLVALIATAGGLSYKNHLDALPAVPFEQLPADQRAEVQRYLSEGQQALDLVRQGGVVEASADAAEMFARAYALHERNPDAVKGLEEAAADFIEYWQSNPQRDRAVEELRKFQAKSAYYKGYAPLEQAIEDSSR
ncbi:MAG TPA: serine/threonine-protein kinase [Steroidobacteraceae bacterium]|nr:serine/threonine-protein kinase [Steroidobacteraceae bacterium]